VATIRTAPAGGTEADLLRRRPRFPLEWDGGYDVDRYPSYGEEWRRSDRPYTDRLRQLGVYELADNEECWMRMHRPR